MSDKYKPQFQQQQQHQQQPNQYQIRLTSKLKQSLNKQIKVSIKIRNTFITGILKEFDPYLNLILEDTTEIIINTKNQEIKRKMGRIVIRGDSVIYIDFQPEKSEIIMVQNIPSED